MHSDNPNWSWVLGHYHRSLPQIYFRKKYRIGISRVKIGPIGLKHCCWLTIGSLTPCEKSCCFEHHKVHRARIRKGAIDPKPCRRCGVEVQAEAHLSKGCGSDRVYHKLAYKERRTRKIFTSVLTQLMRSQNSLRIAIKTIYIHPARIWSSNRYTAY